VDRLEQLVTADTLGLMDCEGCEIELLRQASAPFLREAALLVELHDHVDACVSSTILTRCARTQSARASTARPRATDYPALRDLAPADRAAAVDERRPTGAQWVVLNPVRPDRHATE
jgi:hypothetical protein